MVHIELQYLSKHVLLYRTCRVKISVKTCVIIPYISSHSICQNMCYYTVHIESQYLSKHVSLYRTCRVKISVKTCVIIPYISRHSIFQNMCCFTVHIELQICQNMCYCTVHVELKYLSKHVLLYRTYRVTISVKTCVIVPYITS